MRLFRQINIGRRFMYWPPWTVSDPWMPRMKRGGDEWCNPSVQVILPFAGAFIWFTSTGRTMPCDEDWAIMPADMRADYLPGGYLEGGRVWQDRFDAKYGDDVVV